MNTNSKYFIPATVGAVVLIVVVALLLGSSGGVPDNAVAKVKDEVILKAKFDSILKLYSRQSQPEGADKNNPVVPDPPNFTKCIANKKKSAPKKSTTKQLKEQCENEWNTAKEQIMTTLIQQKWYELEAEDRDIKVTDKQVKDRFIPLKEQTFPKKGQYEKFLKSSGQTEEDLLELVRSNIYQEKVREQVSKPDKITAADVKEYYEKNSDRFVSPPSRDLLVVFTEKKSKANAAAAALKSGESWATVVKQYSEDNASKENGGKFPGVTEGQFEPTLDKAVFQAKKGSVQGPIKTQFGYYVFTVEKANAETKQTLKEAEQSIKQTIEGEQQQKNFDEFQKEFEEKWRKKTKCADLYVISLCKNGEKKEEPTAAAGGAAPPQGGSQTAP